MKQIGGERPHYEHKLPALGQLISRLNEALHFLEDKPDRDKAFLDDVIEQIDQRIELFNVEYNNILTEHLTTYGRITHEETKDTLGLDRVDDFRIATASEVNNFSNVNAFVTAGRAREAVTNYIQDLWDDPFQPNEMMQISSNYISDEYPRAESYYLDNEVKGNDSLIQVGINKGQAVLFPYLVGTNITNSLYVSNPIHTDELMLEAVSTSLPSYTPDNDNSNSGFNQPFINVAENKYLLFSKTKDKVILNYDNPINSLINVRHTPNLHNLPVFLIANVRTNGNSFVLNLDRIELMENTGDGPDEFTARRYYINHLISFENSNETGYDSSARNKALDVNRSFNVNTLTGLSGTADILEATTTLLEETISGKQVIYLVTSLTIKNDNKHYAVVMSEKIEYLNISGIGNRYRVQLHDVKHYEIPHRYMLDHGCGHKGVFIEGRVTKFINTRNGIVTKEFETNSRNLLSFLLAKPTLEYSKVRTRFYPYAAKNVFTNYPYRVIPAVYNPNSTTKYYVYGVDKKTGIADNHVLQFDNGLLKPDGTYNKPRELTITSGTTLPPGLAISSYSNNNNFSISPLVFDLCNDYTGYLSISFNTNTNAFTVGDKVTLSESSRILLDTIFYTENKHYLVVALNNNQAIAFNKAASKSATLKYSFFNYSTRTVNDKNVTTELVLDRNNRTISKDIANTGLIDLDLTAANLTGDQLQLSNMDVQLRFRGDDLEFYFNGYGRTSLGTNVNSLSFTISNWENVNNSVKDLTPALANNYFTSYDEFPKLDVADKDVNSSIFFTIPGQGVRDLGKDRVNNSNISDTATLPSGLEVIIRGRLIQLTEDMHFPMPSNNKYVYLHLTDNQELSVKTYDKVQEPTHKQVLLGVTATKNGKRVITREKFDINFKDWILSPIRRGSTIPVLPDVCGDGTNTFFREEDVYKLPTLSTNSFSYNNVAAVVDGYNSYDLKSLVTMSSSDPDYTPFMRSLKIGSTEILFPTSGERTYTHPITGSTIVVDSNYKITVGGGPHYKGNLTGSDQFSYVVSVNAHGERITASGNININLTEPTFGSSQDYEWKIRSFTTHNDTLAIPSSQYKEPVMITEIEISGVKVQPNSNNMIVYNMGNNGNVTINCLTGAISFKDNGYGGNLVIKFRYGFKNYNLNWKTNQITFKIEDSLIIEFTV